MFFVPPNLTQTIYLGQDANTNLPSPRLWRYMRNGGVGPDGFSMGRLTGDDFLGFGNSIAVAANVGTYTSEGGTYQSWESTGGSIAKSTGTGGIITLTNDTSDTDTVAIQYGSASTLGCISDTAGADKLTIFECRFKLNQGGTGSTFTGNSFIGLAEESLTADAVSVVVTAGTMADKDYIGFQTTETDITSGGADFKQLHIVYNKAGGTDVLKLTVEDAVVDADDAVKWCKAGFVYLPQNDNSKKIIFFIDGVEQATYVTAANIAAALFPDGEEMTFTAAVNNSAAAAKTMQIDWWYWYQAA